MKLIYFCIFFSTAYSLKLNILETIEQNLDESADPCDDLYSYTSIKTDNNETLLDLIGEDYLHEIYNQDLPENYTSRENLTYPNELKHIFKYLRNESYNESVATLAKDYEQFCLNNATKVETLFAHLKKYFPFHLFDNLSLDTNCTRASINLRNELTIGVSYRTDTLYHRLNNMKKHMKNVMAHFWLKKNMHKYDQISKMFNSFKQELRKIFTTTKWIKNSESSESFSEISRQLAFKDIVDFSETSIKNLIEFDKDFDDCVKKLKIESAYFLCFFETYIANTETLNNAESSTTYPNITINNPLLSILSENTPSGFIYGTIGFTIAKELGQIVVMNEENRVFLPYFSNIVKNCTQNQLNHTENLFDKNISSVNVDLLHPVVFAITFAYEQLRKAEGDNLHKPIEGSPHKLTNSQLFFFGVNTLLSKVAKSEGRDLESVLLHSGAVQIPTFKKVFNCPSKSRVMKSKTVSYYAATEK